MNNNILQAFGLTLFAGLSTGIGSAIAFFSRQTNTRFLSVALGFSAGVMTYLSFVEILPKAQAALVSQLGQRPGAWAAVASFFGGVLFIGIIDRLVPEQENPHQARPIENMRPANVDPKLMRMGLFTALSIAIHNFPEGLATFAAALVDPAVGVSTAIAVALHNIPEGISVSVPVYYATGSRKKAFFYSFLSGISEPLGALVGYLVLRAVFSQLLFGVLFGGVGGVMVFISLDELLPTAKAYGEGHAAVYGLVAGMAVMAVSLLLFV